MTLAARLRTPLLVLGAALFAPGALAAQTPPPSPAPTPQPQPPAPDPADLAALLQLRDDHVPGNAGAAYLRLRQRSERARPALRTGLAAPDWQARLLSAVLLAQLPPDEADLEPLGRVLTGHLADNTIRGDALLAGHALVVLGVDAVPLLEAAAWHAEPQLAERCKALRHAITSRRLRERERGRAEAGLLRLGTELAWAGEGTPVAPPLGPPRLTPEVHLEHALVDLGHDERRSNANGALAVLRGVTYRRGLTPAEAEGLQRFRTGPGADLAVPALWEALADEDRQRRQLAAYQLMDRGVEPQPRLLLAALEALEQDEFGSYDTIAVANANQAGAYFLDHPAPAAPYLFRGLKSASVTVRVRSAALLAQARDPRVGSYVPLLVSHLADNDLPDDATLCGRSLALLGPVALPFLGGPAVDEQQAHYLQVIRGAIALRERDPQARLPFSQGGMYGLAAY